MILDLIGGKNLKNPLVIVRIKYIMHLYIYVNVRELAIPPKNTFGV